MPEHPRSDIHGMISEHILIAEEALGSHLVKDEIVHHMNWKKTCNDLSNLLFPISRLEHQRIPNLQAKFLESKGLMEEWRNWFMEHRADEDKTYELELQLNKAINGKCEYFVYNLILLYVFYKRK